LNAYLHEVQETVMAIKTRELQAAHKRNFVSDGLPKTQQRKIPENFGAVLRWHPVSRQHWRAAKRRQSSF
jgi:hypothetical protein